MKLLITKKAEKELDKLPDTLAKTISKGILAVAKNSYPPNSKKLHGQNNFRLRIGSFRVIYTINKKLRKVTILRVADRKRFIADYFTCFSAKSPTTGSLNFSPW